jgi:hypothetical protein
LTRYTQLPKDDFQVDVRKSAPPAVIRRRCGPDQKSLGRCRVMLRTHVREFVVDCVRHDRPIVDLGGREATLKNRATERVGIELEYAESCSPHHRLRNAGRPSECGANGPVVLGRSPLIDDLKRASGRAMDGLVRTASQTSNASTRAGHRSKCSTGIVFIAETISRLGAWSSSTGAGMPIHDAAKLLTLAGLTTLAGCDA